MLSDTTDTQTLEFLEHFFNLTIWCTGSTWLLTTSPFLLHLPLPWYVYKCVTRSEWVAVFTGAWALRRWWHKQIKLWWRMRALLFEFKRQTTVRRRKKRRTQSGSHTPSHPTGSAVCIHRVSALKCSVTKGQFIPLVPTVNTTVSNAEAMDRCSAGATEKNLKK